jgi:thymidylate kinase
MNQFENSQKKSLDILIQLTQNESVFGVLHGFRREELSLKGDIDICCLDIDIFLNELKECILLNRGTLVTENKHFGGGVVLTGVFEENDYETFRYDIYENPMLASNLTFPKMYFSEDKANFLNNREIVHDIYCVNAKYEFIHYFKRKIIKQDFTNEVRNYSLFLYGLVDDAEDIIKKNLNLYANDYINFLKNGTIEKIKKIEIFEYLTNKLEAENKVKKIPFYLTIAKRLARLIKGKKGTHIAFLAPDGAGKTTVIEGLYKKDKIFGSLDYFHLRPTLLPAYSAKARDERENNEFMPHSSSPYRFPLNIMKYLALVFDYSIGYYLKIFPKLYSNNLVVSDRYFYDLFIDPARFRLKKLSFFMFIFNYFIPKPDVVYALLADPEEIISRKQDLTLQAINDQNNIIKSLEGKYKNIIFIDANQSPSNVFNDVFQDVVKRHSLKYFKKQS